jgi:hypothetical protein
MSENRPSMSSGEIAALLGEVARGAVTARTAINLMVVNGEPREEAARRTFLALGGSDATELDHEGRPRYVGTGKLVCEVERAIYEGSAVVVE